MSKQIPLSGFGKYKGMFSAIVDDDDFDRLSKYRWSIAKMYRGKEHALIYAIRTENKKTIYMHREILSAVDGQLIDHVDGDGLNNVKKNLRFSNLSENRRNTFQKRKYGQDIRGVYSK